MIEGFAHQPPLSRLIHFTESTYDLQARRVVSQFSLETGSDDEGRTKEDTVLLLLYGLPRSGQIVLRRIDGRHDMAQPNPQAKAA